MVSKLLDILWELGLFNALSKPSETLLMEFGDSLAGAVIEDDRGDDVIELWGEPKEGVGSIMNVPIENELYKP